MSDLLTPELATPERNRYFYGRLLAVDDFEREQNYFLSRRWLFNRLVHGAGIVCGLDLLRAPEDDTLVRIEPGLAIDHAGRELVLPEPVSIDPSQLTDEEGEPIGDPLDSGTVEICIGYRERRVDPVPVLVADCENPGMCAHAVVEETFCLVVREAEGDPAEPVGCGLAPFPTNAAELHQLLAERVGEPCPEIPEDLCLPLARVALPLADDSLDSVSGRSLVPSGPLFLELVTCLTQEFTQQLAAETLLRYLSGDGQSAAANEQLDRRLIVEVINRDLEPVRGTLVQFEVTSGAGSLSRLQVRSGANGRAATRWTLGPSAGRQAVTARAVGTALSVRFRAEAT